MNQPTLKTISQVRANFWDNHPEYKPERRTRKRQNDYNATIRTAFVDYVDYLHRDGQISDAMAQKVTL